MEKKAGFTALVLVSEAAIGVKPMASATAHPRDSELTGVDVIFPSVPSMQKVLGTLNSL